MALIRSPVTAVSFAPHPPRELDFGYTRILHVRLRTQVVLVYVQIVEPETRRPNMLALRRVLPHNANAGDAPLRTLASVHKQSELVPRDVVQRDVYVRRLPAHQLISHPPASRTEYGTLPQSSAGRSKGVKNALLLLGQRDGGKPP